jgi:hypothetical protein
MDIYGYLWISMDIYGYLWISMDIYGFLWISMDICEYNSTKRIILSLIFMNIVSQRFITKFRPTAAGQW